MKPYLKLWKIKFFPKISHWHKGRCHLGFCFRVNRTCAIALLFLTKFWLADVLSTNENACNFFLSSREERKKMAAATAKQTFIMNTRSPDLVSRHRSLYKGVTPPWKETYRKVRFQVELVYRAFSSCFQ